MTAFFRRFLCKIGLHSGGLKVIEEHDGLWMRSVCTRCGKRI